MTDDIARELGELLEKATPGRWLYNGRMQRVEQDSHVHGRDYRPVASPYNANADADGALIAAARNHLPALLSSRAADRKRIEVLEEALTKAAGQFELYAREHRAKAADQTSGVAQITLVKAETNERFANVCRAALAGETDG